MIHTLSQELDERNVGMKETENAFSITGIMNVEIR
jgi:hypothetical protein